MPPAAANSTPPDKALHGAFQVEVVALWPDCQWRGYVSVESPLTALQVLMQSGVIAELNLQPPFLIGRFGKRIIEPEHYYVQPDDRLELYRALLIDPKQARKKRAERYPVGRMAKRQLRTNKHLNTPPH